MKYDIKDFSLQHVLDFENALKDVPDNEDVIFDFTKVYTYDPLPMLLVGSIIRRYRNEYPNSKFKIEGAEKKGYAGTMGFFKYISPNIDLGKLPGEACGNSNYLPITPIVIDELRQNAYAKGDYLVVGDLLEREASRLARVVDRGNKELHKLLTYLIREILRNTPEHAQSNKMWVCGQYWPSYELAEIAIIDEGIGIFNSISKNAEHAKYITDNSSALQWSLKAGISQALKPSLKQKSNDEWANSGFGLYMVSQICKHLNGSFCLISYDDYMLIDNHGISAGKTSFHGTAIRIRVPSKRIENAQEIINTIANQGENEAKTIRNAFKKASMPSRGLIQHLNIEE